MQSLAEIKDGKALLAFLNGDVNANGNLSIRGVARLAGVADKSIVNGGSFQSRKLHEKLAVNGLEHGSLIAYGFPPQAVILTLEYFAYESKAKAEGAKQVLRTFGTLMLMQILSGLATPVVPPVEISNDVGIATLEVLAKTAEGIAQIHKQTIARLDRIENTAISVGIDVKGEIRECSQIVTSKLGEKLDAIQCELFELKSSVANSTTSQSRKELKIALYPSEERYHEWIALADKSGMSRSQFFCELIEKVLGGE